MAGNGNQNSLTTTAIKKLLHSYAHTEAQANQQRGYELNWSTVLSRKDKLPRIIYIVVKF